MRDPTKVETVGEWIQRTVAQTEARKALLTLLSGRGILTARIIPGPVCETCGGEQRVPDGGRVVSPTGTDIGPSYSPCPTCHGKPAPVRVVMPEAWGAAGAVTEEAMNVGRWRGTDANLARIATALLGGRVEVVETILEAPCDLMLMPRYSGWENVETLYLNPGDRIALLERRTG